MAVLPGGQFIPVQPTVIHDKIVVQHFFYLLKISKPVWYAEHCGCEGDYTIKAFKGTRLLLSLVIAHSETIKLPNVNGEIELKDSDKWLQWMKSNDLLHTEN